ncbi:putative toxin-antitoxin system toxin component, PIN family [Mucilaginibacter arboris]|uniref:Putative toxin-antitoxin system toxin component, PIN family n=1 Tax=Mucilaginibacter arboris TaxID=2682090 RepID=A0A7K1STP5_9SPHI|nr:putative toxin-antitoxin system toxin component, PIN family [Mucilaginibacter arboris]MVN20692.1 putative toxin-antitoxin system toxin component, PIN family [Mucilaginibacter arboris]
MQKVIIDTNVLISALIQRSYPYQIISELFIDQKIVLCIFEHVMQEYYDVLNRKKFSKYPDFIARAESMLAIIESKATVFSPKIKLNLITDLDDNKFLELADECKANFLITGNTAHFTMHTYQETRIVSPKEFWENHRLE